MGRLGDPLNTFWQVFALPAGTSRWSLATPKGMADNGGLVAAIGEDASVVGVLPSGELHFSAVTRSRDLGHSYAVGALPDGILARPDALTQAASGTLLALVGPHDRVVSSDGHLSLWKPVLSLAEAQKEVAATGSCQLRSLDAVAFSASGQEILGGACRRPGTVGLYALTGAALHPVVLPSSTSLEHATVSVLRVDTDGATTFALLLARRGSESSLTAASVRPGQRWRLGSSMTLRSGQRIASLSVSGTGYGAFITGPAGHETFVEDTASGWQRLAPPPPGTAAVATPSGRPPEAITVRGSVFGAWIYDAAQHRWQHAQSISVPIQYGSSG